MSTLLVETVSRGAAAFDPSYRRDTLTLTWEDRARSHGRRRSDAGVEFALSLPTGTVLRNGDCFVLDAVRTIVEVREAPEPVFVIEPRTPQEWASYAYQIGNRHQLLMIGERDLVCPQQPGVQRILEQLRIPYTEASRPFTPAMQTTPHTH
jgi:urease accessory protein UreE